MTDLYQMFKQIYNSEKIYYATKCCLCGKKTGNLQRHHIKPKSEGGKDCIYNIIVLCKECHKKVHNGILCLIFRKEEICENKKNCKECENPIKPKKIKSIKKRRKNKYTKRLLEENNLYEDFRFNVGGVRRPSKELFQSQEYVDIYYEYNKEKLYRNLKYCLKRFSSKRNIKNQRIDFLKKLKKALSNDKGKEDDWWKR